jgi:transposase InsO family protein
MWEDTKLGRDPDEFCETCKLTTARSARKGKSPLDKHSTITNPGEEFHVDILYNPATRCVIPSLHTKFLLGIVDLRSRFMVPMPLHDKEAKNIIKALQAWATQFGPSVTFNLHSIKHIHGDYDSSFTLKDFMDGCNNAGIKVTFAAPRHQEQNGIFERTWQSIRYIAMGDLNHAKKNGYGVFLFHTRKCVESVRCTTT